MCIKYLQNQNVKDITVLTFFLIWYMATSEKYARYGKILQDYCEPPENIPPPSPPSPVWVLWPIYNGQAP